MSLPPKPTLVWSSFGKGKIIADGADEVFGAGERHVYVRIEPCRAAHCLHPNATHLIKHEGPMTGYCCICALDVKEQMRAAESQTKEEREAEVERTKPLLSYGKGTIICKGVDDGPWKEKPRCVVPDCSDPTAWFLVKMSGPWEGHCTRCVIARKQSGRHPLLLASRSAALDAWKTRSAPGADVRVVEAKKKITSATRKMAIIRSISMDMPFVPLAGAAASKKKKEEEKTDDDDFPAMGALLHDEALALAPAGGPPPPPEVGDSLFDHL